ncbi:hypothetical protein DAEQUDRAFT_717342 [Daedalea quercina L-15889]|uniref:DDE Tnp4 domain-containing protein n=1 Tax=Daedalea quercina L-15889 TaxID=1314783 RepID=A0A165LWX2_9APHY|nr:hypothetical protein DAEQUDRAFT_717342 [Daedalea quercina L-15889]
MEVERQLAIYLCQAGRYGTGAAVDEIADWAGVSVGSIYNCARRCMVALAGLHSVAFNSREEEQIQGAKRCAAEKAGTTAWEGGIYATDGSPIKLSGKPGFYGIDFYGKDKIYAIQLTVSSSTFFNSYYVDFGMSL